MHNAEFGFLPAAHSHIGKCYRVYAVGNMISNPSIERQEKVAGVEDRRPENYRNTSHTAASVIWDLGVDQKMKL